MKEEVTIPSVGESIVEGMLMAWYRNTGDIVRRDEDLYEFETEKASVVVPSPFSGLLEVLVPEGSKVNIGQVVATIDTAKAADETPAAGEATERAEEPAPAPAPAAKEKPADHVLSPAVRRAAAELGVDTAGIQGSGKDGRVTKADVMEAAKEGAPKAGAKDAVKEPDAAADTPRPPDADTAGRPYRTTPLSPVRKAIARHLLASRREAAHLTTFNEINMERLMAIRREHQQKFEKRHGIKLGIMSFFVKAAVEALREYPVINGRIEGDEMIQYDFYDIGVAVSTDRGLLVPVIRNADTLTFAEIELRIADLSERARTRKILLPELQGGTFSITNGGVFGSLMSTPIPNHPQSAVLGMHAVKDRPVAVDGAVVIKPMMYVALTYDHRLIDGREAVGFLVRVKEFIENPEDLLLET